MPTTDRSVAEFLRATVAYCAWSEEDSGTDLRGDAGTCLRLLADLYVAGLGLPASPPCGENVEDPRVSDEEWKRLYHRFGALPFGYYGVVQAPHADLPGESGIGDLADDLADIYRDLVRGLRLWEGGHEVEAVWDWRFHFATHWGRHAIEAMQVLHVWLQQEHEL